MNEEYKKVIWCKNCKKDNTISIPKGKWAVEFLNENKNLDCWYCGVKFSSVKTFVINKVKEIKPEIK
jgi:hypothetical protein